VRQQDAHNKRGGAVKTTCNTPVPFSRATSPSLIVCFYLAYWKRRRRMQLCMKN